MALWRPSWPLEGACEPDAAVCRKYESRVPNLLAHFLLSCNNDFEGILALCSLRVVYSSEERVRTICCEHDEAISVLPSLKTLHA